MRWSNPKFNPRHGYALIIVLFSLAVLTLLFSAASTRTLGHIEQISGEIELGQDRLDAMALSRIALSHGAAENTSGEIQVEFNAKRYVLLIQPVTGLIDLNTASPDLLSMLIDGYGISSTDKSAALVKYRAWRREGRRLLRVSDFSRITGLPSETMPHLDRFATVYSGRTGISSEQAPIALLSHLTGQTGSRTALAELLDPSLITASSSANALVLVSVEGGAPRPIANIHYGSNQAQTRIISIE